MRRCVANNFIFHTIDASTTPVLTISLLLLLFITRSVDLQRVSYHTVVQRRPFVIVNRRLCDVLYNAPERGESTANRNTKHCL